MQMEVVSRSAHEVRFEVRGISVAMANALRRIMIAEIPTLAIERVTYEANTTIFQDEYLAHRLGLVPIAVDHSAAGPGAPSEATFAVDLCAAEGEELDFTSRDLVCQTPGVRVVHGSKNGILLGRLLPGQRLRLKAVAVRGTGTEHSKWSAVSTARYSYLADIGVSQPELGENAEVLRDMCPKKVFDVEDGHLIAARPRDCVFCGECTSREAQRLAGTRNLRVAHRSDRYLFVVESAGQMSPDHIVDTAFDVLMSKCDTMLERVSSLPLPPRTPPGTPMEVAYQD